MELTYRLFVSIDWATVSHQVCVLDPQREVLAERLVEPSGAGLDQLLAWLERLSAGQPETVAVGIEMPRGAAVETLIERGFAVFSINPKQLDRFRDRHTVAGAKDDRRDAFGLADSLRTDQPCFRKVQQDEPAVFRLRELSRYEDQVRADLNRLTNPLREQLHHYFPQMLTLSPAADEGWLWGLLERAPTPQRAATLRTSSLERLLRAHRIRRVTSAQIREAFAAPPLTLAPGAASAASEHALLLLRACVC